MARPASPASRPAASSGGERASSARVQPPARRPLASRSARRPLAPSEAQAAWLFAQTVVVSLAVVAGASWRPFSPALADPFSPAVPLLADSANVVGLPPGVGAASAAAEAAWRAHAPADEQAAASVRLSDALRALVPDAGETLVIDPETLWLARCMYSESDLPHEQELVAWVVRNRVATGYRGRWTYRDVVLDPSQFSAFNYDSGRRHYYASLMPNHQLPGWRRTLAIATFVRHAPWSRRPFPVNVRHFYSEISMVGRRAPVWAIGHRPVRANRLYPVDPYRFRFLALREGTRT